MKYIKPFNESYKELDTYHNEEGYQWEQDHKWDNFSKNDIIDIKKIINKLNLISPSYHIKNNKIADKFKILIGDDYQQKFMNINPELPFKNTHTIEIEILNIIDDKEHPKFSLKIYVSKFQDDWFKVDYNSRYWRKVGISNTRKMSWVDDHNSHRQFVCDQIYGVNDIFNGIISEISDDKI